MTVTEEMARGMQLLHMEGSDFIKSKHAWWPNSFTPNGTHLGGFELALDMNAGIHRYNLNIPPKEEWSKMVDVMIAATSAEKKAQLDRWMQQSRSAPGQSGGEVRCIMDTPMVVWLRPVEHQGKPQDQATSSQRQVRPRLGAYSSPSPTPSAVPMFAQYAHVAPVMQWMPAPQQGYWQHAQQGYWQHQPYNNIL